MKHGRINKRKLILLFFLLLLSLATLMPFYYMVTTSIKTMDAYLGEKVLPPRAPTLQNYITIFSKFSLGSYFVNNFIILAGTLIPYILMCSAAGFAFAQLRFPNRVKRPVEPLDDMEFVIYYQGIYCMTAGGTYVSPCPV